MDQQPLYIYMSPEIQEVLADNGIDIVDELARHGFSIERGTGLDPTASLGNQTKDVSLIILASATAVGAVTMGIAQIINALGNKPVIVKNKELIPVRDEFGDVVHDEQGKVVMHTKEEWQALGGKTPNESQMKFDFGGIFRFEFGTGKGGEQK